MRKNLIVKQDGYKECGSAALLSIIRYYHGDISINRLVELTNTTKMGTSFYDLKQAAFELGLEAKGYKVEDIKSLQEIKDPYICQFQDNNLSHFVVVYKLNNEKVTIMDPAKGKVIMNVIDFSLKWTGYIMVFSPFKKLPVYISDNILNKTILKTLIINKNIIIKIIILSLLFTIFACLSSFYLQITFDKISKTTISNLIIITLIFVFILLIKNLSSYFRNLLVIMLNQKIDLSLIINAFNKVLLLPHSYYKNKTTGEVISRINDLSYIKNFISQITITVFLDIIIILTTSIILYILNKDMFFILIIITIIYFGLMIIFRLPLKKMTKNLTESQAKVNSLLVELIASYETIKALHLEKLAQIKFEKRYFKNTNEMATYEKIISTKEFIATTLISIATLLLMFLGSYNIMKNNISIGTFLSFNFLMTYYLESIKNIGDFLRNYYYAKESLKKANNLLQIASDDFTNRSNLEITGDIEIRNLNFAYHLPSILKNVNLKIKKGEKVMILGNSGSGKSSLIKLLYSYYKPERGQIFYNNYDILDYYLDDIRSSISLISQNEILYTDTIRNNIILDRKISDSNFLNITKLTYVEDIIKNKFLGYDTFLEENGANLSGGEKQRIILARALLKESNLLLIDEGLNQMDINLERKILKNIFNYYSSKTIIIVSHRLENMDLFDKVIKLENGEVTAIISKNKGNYEHR